MTLCGKNTFLFLKEHFSHLKIFEHLFLNESLYVNKIIRVWSVTWTSFLGELLNVFHDIDNWSAESVSTFYSVSASFSRSFLIYMDSRRT